VTFGPDFKVTTFYEVEYQTKERQSYYCTRGKYT